LKLTIQSATYRANLQRSVHTLRGLHARETQLGSVVELRGEVIKRISDYWNFSELLSQVTLKPC